MNDFNHNSNQFEGPNPILIARGRLDGSSASEIVRTLETYPDLQFPIVLDFSGLQEINWLGLMVLSSGISRLRRSRGEVIIRNYVHFLKRDEESKMISALINSIEATPNSYSNNDQRPDNRR